MAGNFGLENIPSEMPTLPWPKPWLFPPTKPFFMKKIPGIFLLLLSAIVMVSCNQSSEGVSQPPVRDSAASAISDSLIIPSTILTKEQQDKLTPDEVVSELMKGNEAYVNDRLTIRNTSARIREASLGQYPKAVILSCLDSRVPVEDVFHEGIGDLFFG